LHGVECVETLLFDGAGPVIWIGGLIVAPPTADENGGGSQDSAEKAAPEDKVKLPRKN
jgi:hypothetical protein